jgi:hypothetical protein
MSKQTATNADSCTAGKDLPNTDSWVPRDKAATSLASAFEKRCAIGEKKLQGKIEEEKSFAVDNFDSGLPFEAAVRDEVRELIPNRYEITSGHLVDRHGMVGGQCDIVVFNRIWFTPVNAPTGSQPTRILFPIEGVYAAGEVKQHLTTESLDDAMEKLVVFQRLHRPPTFAHRFTENRDGASCNHGLTNPLFTFIVAGGVDNIEFSALIGRFVEINRKLKRLELVRCLCVLGAGTVTWAFVDPLNGNEIRPALFMKSDLFNTVAPAFAPSSMRPPLYSLMQMLHLHLYHSILAPDDITSAYGLSVGNIKLPKDPKFSLPPDQQWTDRLKRPCQESAGD